MLPWVSSESDPEVDLGIVSTVSRDADHGWMVAGQYLDGRDLTARVLRVGAGQDAGDYWPIDRDAEVVVLCPGGDPNAAIVVGSPTSREARAPASWTGDYHGAWSSRHEYRSDANPDAVVEGVLLRPLLDDLVTLVTAVETLITALTTAATGSQDGGAAYKANIASALSSSGVSTALTNVKSALNQSRAGQGGAPHASAILRAATD